MLSISVYISITHTVQNLPKGHKHTQRVTQQHTLLTK